MANGSYFHVFVVVVFYLLEILAPFSLQPAAAYDDGDDDRDDDDDLDDSSLIADCFDFNGLAFTSGARRFAVRRHGEPIARRWQQIVNAERREMK